MYIENHKSITLCFGDQGFICLTITVIRMIKLLQNNNANLVRIAVRQSWIIPIKLSEHFVCYKLGVNAAPIVFFISELSIEIETPVPSGMLMTFTISRTSNFGCCDLNWAPRTDRVTHAFATKMKFYEPHFTININGAGSSWYLYYVFWLVFFSQEIILDKHSKSTFNDSHLD